MIHGLVQVIIRYIKGEFGIDLLTWFCPVAGGTLVYSYAYMNRLLPDNINTFLKSKIWNVF